MQKSKRCRRKSHAKVKTYIKDPARSRGPEIKFTLNLHDMVNINYNDKISQISNEIKIGHKRNLKPAGKITIIRSLFLSILKHLFASIPNPNKEMSSKLKKNIFLQFHWEL